MNFPLLVVLLAALHAAEAPQNASTHRVLFQQPELAGFGERMFVQARVPLGEFPMVGWQQRPFTPDGKFRLVGWDVGGKDWLLTPTDAACE